MFIVGCGRSGTTLLYDVVAAHPSVAWFSNYTSRWPRAPVLASTHRFYRIDRLRASSHRFVPRPSEGYPIWDRIHPVPPAGFTPPLGAGDTNGMERSLARHLVASHVRFARAERFVNKNTRNVTRLPYVLSLFPDAYVIHVLRDPTAVVASLLGVSFWPDLKVWCFDGLTPRQWSAQGGDPVEMAATLWRREVDTALADKQHVAADRYMEIRYEQLVARPEDIIRRLLAFVDLPWTATFDRAFRTFTIDDANPRLLARLSPDDQQVVRRVTADVAFTVGYSAESP